jgi:hypothetical protein
MLDLDKLTGFTKGPWEIDTGRDGYWQVSDKQDAICCNSFCYAGYGNPELDAANARLIASAPELLAEVKRLREALLEISQSTIGDIPADSSWDDYSWPRVRFARVREIAHRALEPSHDQQ